jgi:hypothetical protein
MANETVVLVVSDPHKYDGLVTTFLDTKVSVIPLWSLILVAIGVILFLLLMYYWLRRFKVMGAFGGFLDAEKANDIHHQQTWLISQTGAFKIVCLELWDNVLSYPIEAGKNDMWFLSSIHSPGSCAGRPLVICSPQYDLVQDPVSSVAITAVCERFNETFKQNEDGLPVYEMVRLSDGTDVVARDTEGYPIRRQITDGQRFLDLLARIQVSTPNGVEVSGVSSFDPGAVQRYLKRNSTASFFGFARTTRAEDLMKSLEQPDFYSKFGGLIVVGVIMVAAIILTWQVFR